MSQKTRGVFETIFKSFIAGILRKKSTPKLMGEDFYGTKYYEFPPELQSRKNKGRFFTPVNKDDFQQEIPAEWEAWLRHRRREAPTNEEVEANYKLMLMKRANAAKLEREYNQQKDAQKSQITDHASSTYPQYQDYETEKPGKSK